MNKKEIKKALHCCSTVGSETSCSDCSYVYRCRDLCKDALDLITEQEKKIDALKEKCVELCDKMWDAQDDLDCYYDEMPNKVKQAKIEAVKEFAGKLKIKAIRLPATENYHVCNFIDELLEEYEK